MTLNLADHAPTIEIGLVVRNGERHIAEAIDSWRRQTRDDWRLVVHDNASSDGTTAVVEDFARRDPRILLLRHERNIGMTGNFRFALARAESPLFCWSAADDLREPMFLDRLLERLESDDALVMAAASARSIAPDGAARDVVRRDATVLGGLSSGDPALRVHALLREPAYELIFGVMRTEVARRAMLPVLDQLEREDGRPQFGGDVLLMAALAVAGPIAFEREPLLALRDGGHSHQRDAHHSLADLLRDLLRYRTLLMGIVRPSMRATSVLAPNLHWLNVLRQPSMRRRMLDHLAATPRPMRRLAEAITVLRDPALRRLRSRLRAQDHGTGAAHRIVLSGGGQHTARRLGAIRHAIGRRGRIVGILDESASCLAARNRWGIPCIAPSDLRRHRPTLIIVSSDAYEAALFDLAIRHAPDRCVVWPLYDPALERASATPRHAAPTAMTDPPASAAPRPTSPAHWKHIDGAA